MIERVYYKCWKYFQCLEPVNTLIFNILQFVIIVSFFCFPFIRMKCLEALLWSSNAEMQRDFVL